VTRRLLHEGGSERVKSLPDFPAEVGAKKNPSRCERFPHVVLTFIPATTSLALERCRAYCGDDAAERINELTAFGLGKGFRMPVTAKLSRKFYERLGDDIVTELVDWFNAVDSTYQTQLREINDLNWERFKSDMGAMRVEWRAEIATTRAELRAEIATLGAELRKEMAELAGALRAEMAALRAEMIKWMFIFWCGQMIGLGGLIVGLQFFGPR